MKSNTAEFRVGQGIDIHAFVSGRELILGGVKIPYEFGLGGHSDADVLVHAVMDALLGAAGAPDIGILFPNTNPSFKDANSIELLKSSYEMIQKDGWRVGNIDCMVLAEAPKIAPYISQMKEKIGSVLKIEGSQIGIKATTAEKLGFVGRKEGIVASVVCLLQR